MCDYTDRYTSEASLDEERGKCWQLQEVEKKGGEERGVMSTVISSINMWNRPMEVSMGRGRGGCEYARG